MSHLNVWSGPHQSTENTDFGFPVQSDQDTENSDLDWWTGISDLFCKKEFIC